MAKRGAAVKTISKRDMDQTWEYIRRAYRMPASYGKVTTDPTRPDPLGYELLARYRPEVLNGYITLRKAAKSNPGSPLSDAMKELIIVAIECARTKTNGPPTGHAIRAIHAGATVAQVAETVSLCILIGGMLTYQESGKHALRAAEETAAMLAVAKGQRAAKRAVATRRRGSARRKAA